MGDFDWGDFIWGGLASGFGWGAGTPGIVPGQSGASFTGGGPTLNPTSAGYYTDPVTGEVKKKKCRRRRRRLLTPTDLSDLAALKSIVGNGDALKFAVTKAVRR